VETLESYLEKLASGAPTPGGGSAATVVGACAAALVAMVARITIGNPAHAAKIALAEDLIREADELRERFSVARIADERAYGEVVAAMALPRATPAGKAERTEVLQAALAGAAAAPLHAAGLAVATLRLTEAAFALENEYLTSDLWCAASFARASLEASAVNVRINHAYLKDAAFVLRQEDELRALERAGTELDARVNRSARA